MAIKVLPAEFAQDEERLRRFQREAKLLASLNHANIATLHGLEKSGDMQFLVMELVEGETLAELIARGPIPIDEALALFKGIADGLEAAHGKGVIHRDLKPANVKISPDGTVTILDFGIAKALVGEDELSVDASQSQSPTLARSTALGTIMGTASYMSPEQARGKLVDKRADVWAFGCCLYEALVGRKVFEEDTVTDTLAAIIKNEPDWTRLPSEVPFRVREVLELCLEKNARKRLRDVGDARIQFDRTDPDPGVSVEADSTSGRPLKSIAIAALAALVGGFLVFGLTQPAPPAVTRFTVPIPPLRDLRLVGGRAVLSPDGRTLVYVGEREGGRAHLFARPMQEFEPKPIDGTEGASQPFFSPDGQWVAFFARGELKKVRLSGGPPTSIAAGALGSSAQARVFQGGGSWASDGHIFYSEGLLSVGLLRVEASGGIPEQLTSVDGDAGELAHLWPETLLDGRAVLYTASVDASRNNIGVHSLETGERWVLIEDAVAARYIDTGHILFARGGVLLAIPFDVDRLEVTGEAFPVVDNLATDVYGPLSKPQFAVAENGTLAYVSDSPGVRRSTLMWVDRQGEATPITDVEQDYLVPRLSPDGRRLALTLVGEETGRRDIWILELSRQTLTRFTFGPGDSTDPVWAPDGSSIAFSSGSKGAFALLMKPATGTGDPVVLAARERAFLFPRSFSPDGRRLLFDYLGVREDRARDIDVLKLDAGEPATETLLGTPFRELEPSVSSDGRWFAYVSDESGRWEVYVRPFSGPEPDRKWQVSTEGGTEPAWARSGRELFYRNGDKMMSVGVSAGVELDPEAPVMLFEERFELDPFAQDSRNYDVTSDGQRFVMIRREENEESQLHIVLNWFQELRRLAPAEN